MTLNSEADEFFRTRPDDIDPDEEIQDKLIDFEEKHLTERERKLINQKED